MPAIKVESEQQWHELRKKHVGASESAALFDESPYVTLFGLWHEKAGTYEDDRDSDFLRWGNRLEPVIAKGIASDNNWDIQKVHQYHQHPAIKGMGASLDYRFVNDPRGPGAYEIKNVDRSVFHDKFVIEGQQIVEAPLYFELQLQHQMACTGYQWGRLGALVGGNKSYYLERERHQGSIEALEAAIVKFWDTIHKKEEPDIKQYQDLIYAKKMFSGARILEVENERLDKYGFVLKDLQEQHKDLGKAIDVCKAQIIREMQTLDAEEVKSEKLKFTNKLTKVPSYVVKDKEYRALKVTTVKAKAKKDETPVEE